MRRPFWTSAVMLATLAAAVLAWNTIVEFTIVTKPLYHVGELGMTYTPGSTLVHGREGYSRLTFDRWGYNNDESSAPVDILVLGDSHTEALQVARDDNFVSQTQKRLAAHGRSLRVYNAGFSARSWADYLHLGESFSAAFHPGVTVVQVSRGDLSGDSIDPSRPVYLKPTGSGWTLVANPESTQTNNWATELASSIPLVALLGAQLKEGLLDDPWGTRRPFLPAPPRADSGKQEAEVNLTSLVDAEMSGLKALFGPRLIVLYLRYTPDVGYDALRYQNEADDEAWVLLQASAKRFEMNLVDTGPQLRAVAEHGHFPRGFSNTEPGSGHLNEYGHAAVAEALADAIEALP